MSEIIIGVIAGLVIALGIIGFMFWRALRANDRQAMKGSDGGAQSSMDVEYAHQHHSEMDVTSPD